MAGAFSRIVRLLIVSAATCAAVSAAQGANRFEKSLMKLNPEERAHQVCVIKGLDTIRRDKRFSKIDRLVPDIFKRAEFVGNAVTAAGAAMRVGKRWYAVSFTCTLADSHLTASTFAFQPGEEIPSDRWEDVGLWQ